MRRPKHVDTRQMSARPEIPAPVTIRPVRRADIKRILADTYERVGRIAERTVHRRGFQPNPRGRVAARP